MYKGLIQEGREKAAEQAVADLQELRLIDCDGLARTEEFGSANSLEPAMDVLQQTVAPLVSLRPQEVSALSLPSLESISRAAVDVKKFVQEVSLVRPGSDELNSRVVALGRASMKLNREVVKATQLALLEARLARVQAGVDRILGGSRESEEVLSQIRTIEGEARFVLQGVRADVKSVSEQLEAARALNEKGAVGANSKQYQSMADKHRSASRWWLLVVGMFASLLLLFAWYSLGSSGPGSGASPTSVTVFVLGRAMVFSVLTFMLVFSGRTYRAHKHNQAGYEHRASALKSFMAFVAATDDDDVRGVLLANAANAAFAMRSTGFDASSQESIDGSLVGLDSLLRSTRGSG